ncbi:uncharacterized protein LOC132945815 isoform X2 [Metopolophium dirhodum]|uniref:uncharacterized protein LOC132945814 isoform X2 n=1 Tax=Metopolophium dirhodum TaxID=44670 RepID=UPI00298FED12|nr:uncharacterized protein LOC132945814 isoform X2 [Metopolophium dirhodum]XP_060871570.1 uncharacterized protein LOC132945815 isoform X2 [Metopolophium dirhodum]
MNRLSIILAIAFVSYSLGAPQNISESQNGDQNHGLEHGSGQGLEKQDGFGDASTSDPSQIKDFIRFYIPRTGISNSQQPKDPKNPNGGTLDGLTYPRICAVACGSGLETYPCLMCMNKFLKQNKII